MSITKTGVFSLVGRPNVGKSTLLNALTGTKVAIVSSKPQTTRTRITGVVNDGEYQLVFLDTPGVHKPVTRLGEYMVKLAGETAADADTAVLMVEPVANIGAPEQQLIDRFRSAGVPAILVVNKIDTVKKDALLAVMAAYAQAYDFQEIIPISAATGEGLEELKAALKQQCFESPQLFPDGMVTDMPEKQLIAETIREKLLRLLDKEVPHGIAIEVEQFSERDNGILDIAATIYCERESHKGIIIGKRGAMLKKVGELARRELEELFDGKVYLQLWVKTKEGWRNQLAALRNFGFESE